MASSLHIAQVTPRLAGTDADATDELTWQTACQIRDLIVRREVSPVAVVDHFLARIEALDPEYHAFRMVDPEGARTQALRAQQAAAAGHVLGPLHGVPIAIKEHVAVEGMAWWDASTAEHRIAPRDSIETERLRAAGAIVVGTTVAGLTAREFGDSDLQPQNPWGRDRVCGDSSSGSACAVAAGMVPLAIAADGLGSTRLPAAFCGLVGINPTRGRVATSSWSELNPKLLSTVGPLSRDVRDAATVLSILAGPDGRDLMGRPDPPPDYLAGLSGDIAGMRLAWTDDFGFAAAHAGLGSATVIAAIRRAAFGLSRIGAVVENADVQFADPGAACGVILLADRNTAVGREPSGAEVLAVQQTRESIWKALERCLEHNEFLLSPTSQHLAATRMQWAESWARPGYMETYSAHTGLANLLGWPAISLPAGLSDGMPIGLQVLGKPDSEPRMFRLAQAILSLGT